MTESRGAMTAQQVERLMIELVASISTLKIAVSDPTIADFIMERFKAYQLAADALFAHNTAELRAALEAKEKELLRVQQDLDRIQSGRRGEAERVTARLGELFDEINRLRSQGAGRELCFAESCPVHHPHYHGEYGSVVKVEAGLASPPEVKP